VVGIRIRDDVSWTAAQLWPNCNVTQYNNNNNNDNNIDNNDNNIDDNNKWISEDFTVTSSEVHPNECVEERYPLSTARIRQIICHISETVQDGR